MIYRELARHLVDFLPNQRVISLSLLKNEVKIADELPTRSIVEIASEAVQYILHNEDGPYSIHGHCVGSYLALEIANQLEQNKIKVNSLFVSATYPVSNWLTPLPFHDPWCFHSDQKLLKNLEHWKTEKFDADKITLSHILKSFRTDAKVAYHYQRTVSLRRLSCPLFCIYAEDDPLTRGGAYQVCPLERIYK